MRGVFRPAATSTPSSRSLSRTRYWNVAQAPRRASNIRYTCHSVSSAGSDLRASRQSAHFGKRLSPRASATPCSIRAFQPLLPHRHVKSGLAERVRQRAKRVPVERLRGHESAVLIDVLRRRHSTDHGRRAHADTGAAHPVSAKRRKGRDLLSASRDFSCRSARSLSAGARSTPRGARPRATASAMARPSASGEDCTPAGPRPPLGGEAFPIAARNSASAFGSTLVTARNLRLLLMQIT